MEIKLILTFACVVAIILSAIFGILSAYAEIKSGQPRYSVYMKLSATLIGIAGVLVALITAF